MKIVIVGSYPIHNNRIGGGVEASVYGLAHELSRSHEVVVYDMPRQGGIDIRESEGKLSVVRISNPGYFNLSGNRRCHEIVKKIVEDLPDVCHIHGTGLLACGIYKELTRKKIPVLLTVHGLANVEKRQALQKGFSLRKWFRYVYQSAVEFNLISNSSEVVVDSNYVKRALEEYKAVGKIRQLPAITVVPQGINRNYFQLNCSKETLNVLSVGGFAPRKGHLFLLKAFDKVAAELPNAVLTVVGNKVSESYYSDMLRTMEALPCRERIRLLPDLEQDKLFEVISQAHVFALHSQEESQGIVFAEAMATGLPVVATRVGGIPDVVEDGRSGLLTEYADVDMFAASMIELLSNKEKWALMSSRALQLSSKYDWFAIANRIEEIYDKLIVK